MRLMHQKANGCYIIINWQDSLIQWVSWSSKTSENVAHKTSIAIILTGLAESIHFKHKHVPIEAISTTRCTAKEPSKVRQKPTFTQSQPPVCLANLITQYFHAGKPDRRTGTTEIKTWDPWFSCLLPTVSFASVLLKELGSKKTSTSCLLSTRFFFLNLQI